MNKKFTMVCASLLLASAFSVNAQTSVPAPEVEGLASPTIVSAVSTVEVTEGYKFYLGDASKNLLKVSVADNKAVIAEEPAGTLPDAAIFEVRNLKKVGTTHAQFELYVKGVKVYNATKNNSSFYVTLVDGKFLPSCLSSIKEVVFGGEGAAFYTGRKAYTTQLIYSDADLNNYNKNNTTFSFDFTDDELVGNEFKEVVPVTVDADELVSGAVAGTYFVKGAKEDVDKFVKEQTVDNAKKISFLAVNKNNRYQLNTSNSEEGYALYWMKGENIFKDAVTAKKDSLNNAAFTNIQESDMLNNAEVLKLTMENTTLNQTVDIAAVKASATDTKAYVTTVAAASSWAVIKNAMLGSNTYLAASEFLKKDAINTVSILVVNGKVGGKHYYHYVTSDYATEDVNYLAASELDFSMAQNQWVVTNFDGKYTLTLKNRLSDKTLTLRLAKTDAGYEVLSGLDQILGADDKNTNPVVKFIGLSTTQTDGYLTLTEDQMKKGIKLSFSGETALAGEKEFYGVYDEDKAYMIPSLESTNSITLYAEEYKTSEDKPVYGQNITYAYLDANGKVQTKEEKNNLVVPTYKFYIKNDAGELLKGLGADYAIESGSKKENIAAVPYTFAKNAAGNYSLLEVETYSSANVKTIADDEVIGVTYNPTNAADNKALQFTTNSRYDKNVVNTLFANVNVLPNVILNATLPAVPGHYTFDNERGSINVKDLKGINEGFLASEGQVFWLDTADIENEIPSFYVSFGKDSVAARNYMFNPIDSAKIFDEFTANYKYNKVYYYGEEAPKNVADEVNHNLKAAFASTVAEEGKDLADAFKFNITLKDAAVADEYVISSVKNSDLYVGQKNGVVILTNKDNAMAFTVNPAEAPTSNESVVASEVKVVAQNGSVVVKNAAGKNVVVSTILGQVVANEVLTSDNATINVPAGIVVVAVEGESFKVNVK